MLSLADDRVNRSIGSTIELAHFGRDRGSFFLKNPSFAGVHGNMAVALGLDPVMASGTKQYRLRLKRPKIELYNMLI